jgi:hypothetical protein
MLEGVLVMVSVAVGVVVVLGVRVTVLVLSGGEVESGSKMVTS